MLAVLLTLSANLAVGNAQGTDFGVRQVGASSSSLAAAPSPLPGSSATLVSLRAAAALGLRWGRVTSTYRSPEHNRRVGGVPRSFHLSGRAIDIARRPGVSHGAVEAAYRNAGYHILESLDEGDHSHIAFDFAPARLARTQAGATVANQSMTSWRIVEAPR